MTFAEGAMRCWGIAAQDLGWSPAEFWMSTPAELLASLRSRMPGFEPFAAELLEELQSRFPD